MKIDRLLSITMLFLSRRTVTARQLADKFEVTVRTIYRDIETLRNAGIPIIASQGVGGGLGIHNSFSIDRQILTVDDMLSILTSLKGLEATFARTSEGDAFDKIHALVPKGERSRVDTLIARTRIDLHPWGCNDAVRGNLAHVQRALADNRLLSFTYRATNGAVSRRTIESAQSIFKTYTWYVYGYCRARRDFRLFRLSRMTDCVVEPERFTSRPAPPPDDLFALDSRPRIQVTLRFASSKRAHLEDYFSSDSLTIHKDGSITAVFETPEDDWLYGMILSHGDQVEVLSPPRIRTIIREKAEKIASMHQT